MRSHFPSRGTFLEVVRYLRIATHGVDLGVKRRQVLHRQPARRGGGTPGLSGTRRKFLIGEELSKVGNPIAGSNLVSAWVPYPLAVLIDVRARAPKIPGVRHQPWLGAAPLTSTSGTLDKDEAAAAGGICPCPLPPAGSRPPAQPGRRSRGASAPWTDVSFGGHGYGGALACPRSHLVAGMMVALPVLPNNVNEM